jgi:Cys-rich repeat protein
MTRALLALLLFTAGHVLAAGCGDVTSDLIVRAMPEAGAQSCGSDAECAPPSPRCELPSGVCVACLEDDDCAAGNVCALPANVCAERCIPSFCGGSLPVCDFGTGSCRPCTDDAACPAGAPHCLASGACVACRQNSDCSADEDGEPRFCDPAGRCVECLDDGHCDDIGERCSSYLGACAEPCSPTDPCRADDPICDESIGFCVECRSDRDCGDGVLCRGSECADD